MKPINCLVFVLIISVMLTGCISFSKYTMPRTDQGIQGNQGVLKGDTPSASQGTAGPREVVRMDVEILDFSDFKVPKANFNKEKTIDKDLKGNQGYIRGNVVQTEPKKRKKAARSGKTKPRFWPTMLPRRVEQAEEDAGDAAEDADYSDSAPLHDIYVVKRGETLSEISARPEIYGTSRKWRKIYDANRDKLTNPNKIKSGQKLKIPRD